MNHPKSMFQLSGVHYNFFRVLQLSYKGSVMGFGASELCGFQGLGLSGFGFRVKDFEILGVWISSIHPAARLHSGTFRSL